MLEKFRSWYLRNYVEITWFLIGWLTIVGLQDLSVGNYVGCAISWTFAYINYLMYRR